MVIRLHKYPNSPIWAKIFIKRDRFLGKFKKGPPHIGEYDKNDILEEGDRLVVLQQKPSGLYKKRIQIQIPKYKSGKIRKYISKNRIPFIYLVILYYISFGNILNEY